MADLYGTRKLTSTEQRVVGFVCQGMKRRAIGQQLGTTEHVVANYLRAIYDKTGMDNQVGLALWALSKGLAN
ncbi:MAG TPA: LuxR C-terminal-related transcriptional regulator [Candidatus Sulfotelmatobacter sp.]